MMASALRIVLFLLAAALLPVAAGCTLNDRLQETAIDPVCGRPVEKSPAALSLRFLRKDYFFDSEECARAFDAHPARYCDVASAMYPVYDY